MIQSKHINGVDVNYAIANPLVDDICAVFKLGATVKGLGQLYNADAAMTVNFANNVKGIPIGRLIVEGKEVISDEPKTIPRDEIYTLPDKTLHMGKAPKGSIWSVQGSPPLLRDGIDVIDEGIKRDQTGNDIWTKNAYRNAGGITSDGRYVGVRTLSTVSLKTLRGIMEALGCRYALNFDGGGSACMWPADTAAGRLMGASLNIKWGGARDVIKLIGDSKPELVIDPGHGGSDPGASGNGIIEKLMTLAISLYQFHRFKELGVKVALTRDSDITLGNVERAALVKNSGAKYCISNHINASASTGASASGVEVIHSKHSDGKLAKAMVDHIAAAGQNKRATPTFSKLQSDGQDYYFMHRWTGNASTVIVEYGFCTNAADATRLQANWQAYAESVVRAYCSFVGHKYVAPKTTVVPPVTPPSKPVEGFADIAGHWALPSIQKAIKVGAITGVAVDRWDPDRPPTRAELAVILDRRGLLD